MEVYLCQPNLTMERLPGEGEKERRERGDKVEENVKYHVDRGVADWEPVGEAAGADGGEHRGGAAGGGWWGRMRFW